MNIPSKYDQDMDMLLTANSYRDKNRREYVKVVAKCSCGRGGWNIHLQQMVISDDSIKYLGEHLND